MQIISHSTRIAHCSGTTSRRSVAAATAAAVDGGRRRRCTTAAAAAAAAATTSLHAACPLHNGAMQISVVPAITYPWQRRCFCPAKHDTYTCGGRRAPNVATRAATQQRKGSGSSSSSSSSSSSGSGSAIDEREAHKIFDEAVITVRSGAGGSGEIVEAGAGKYVKNHKYRPGGNQPKQVWLPASDPADGADGADVVLVCDAAVDSLLHLHKRKSYAGARGSNANPATGSGGPKRAAPGARKAATPPLLIPVPPGTVVKRKGSGAFLGELLRPGERLLVAKGGKGGAGTRAPSREAKDRDSARGSKLARRAGAEVVEVADANWQADTRGLPGQQLSLQLLLRVVADVGIVGFPNAGKSSLLAALTRAAPAVAPYPFTTLSPNLGVLSAGGGGGGGAAGGGAQGAAPVLADLPGLIEGAHAGRGLGRNFLRHLRRTAAILHVVDAAAADPATDYWAVREELRMYNPDYTARPHVVALNKMDLEDAGSLRAEVAAEVAAAAARLAGEHGAGAAAPPVAIVPVSAASGEGLAELVRAIGAALDSARGGGGGSNGGSGGSSAFEQLAGGHAAAAAAAAGFVASSSQAQRDGGGGGGSGGGSGSRDSQERAGGAEFGREGGGDGDDGDEAWQDGEGDEEEGEEEGDDWDEETAAAAARWQKRLESGAAAAAGAARGGGGGASAEDDDADAPAAADEVASEGDEDLWLLELSEEQLLAMEID